MLEVHLLGFPGREAEQLGVEEIDAVEESPPAGAALAGHLGPGVIERVGVPPARGHGGDGIHALLEQLPEGLGTGGAREAAAQANDGDGLVRGGARRVRGGRRGVLSGEVAREPVDGRVLVDEGGRKGASEPRLQLAREAHGPK